MLQCKDLACSVQTQRKSICGSKGQRRREIKAEVGIPKLAHNIDVQPKEVVFEDFQVGKEYQKNIQVLNRGFKTVIFEVLPLESGSEFKHELLCSQFPLIPGMRATVVVHLFAQTLHDKFEILTIREDNGHTLNVELRARRHPPSLTLTGKDITFFSESQMIDVGYFLVGSNNMIHVCLEHPSGAARFYFLPQIQLRDEDELEVDFSPLQSKEIYLKHFTLKSVHFDFNKNSRCRLSIEFHPQHSSECLDQVMILCDNGATNSLTFRGHGVEFAKSHMHFQHVEAKDGQAMNMNGVSCDWYYDMGPVTGDVTRAMFTVRNICPARNTIPYEWRLNQEIFKQFGSVSLIPSSGELAQSSYQVFQVVCKIPTKVSFNRADFVARLECTLPQEALSKEFHFPAKFIEEYSENKMDGADLTPSFIKPCDTDGICICVGSIQFKLRKKVAISFEPACVNIPVPLAVNHEIRHHVKVKNECIRTLTCEWRWKKDERVDIRMIPTQFTLLPAGEVSAEICIKSFSYEPIEFEISCLVAQSLMYRPKIKVKLNTATNVLTVARLNQSKKALRQNENFKISKRTKFISKHFPDLADKCHGNNEVNRQLLEILSVNTTRLPKHKTVEKLIEDFKRVFQEIEQAFYLKSSDGQKTNRYHASVRLKDEELCPELVSLLPSAFHVRYLSTNAEVFTVKLVNNTCCRWMYGWGQPDHIEEETLDITVDEKRGILEPRQTKSVLISIRRFKKLLVEKVFIPCKIEGLEESIGVIIHFDTTHLLVDVGWKTHDNTTMQFTWPDDELIEEKISWCGLDVFCMKRKPSLAESISSKSNSSLSEENFLSFGSFSSVSKLSNSFNSQNTSKISSLPLNSEGLASEIEKVSKYSKVGLEQHRLLYSEYACIFINFLHFNNVGYKVPTKQTITIFNRTMSPLRFKLSVRYFRQREIDVKSGTTLSTSSNSNWDESLDERKGLLIQVKKEECEITKDFLDIDVWVYASSWGLYMDTLTVQFESLPPFQIPVSVAISHPPMIFETPSCLPESSPVYKFTVSFNGDNRLLIPLRNTSGLPLKIVWNIKDEENNSAEIRRIASELINFGKEVSNPEASLPQQSSVFYMVDKIMTLSVNKGKQMLTVQFNTNLMDANVLLYSSHLIGYAGVRSTGKVTSLGVYRELRRVSCQIQATVASTNLAFVPRDQDSAFMFQASGLKGIYTAKIVHKEKSFAVKNMGEFPAKCCIRVEEPFSIDHVTVDGFHPVDFTRPVVLTPQSIMQLFVRCSLTPDILDSLRFETEEPCRNVSQCKALSTICCRHLMVSYNHTRSLSLQLKVCVHAPIIHLSAAEIHFPPVYIGDTAGKVLLIRIKYGVAEDICIPTPVKGSPFQFKIESNNHNAMTLRVMFTPQERRSVTELFEFTGYKTRETLRVVGCGTEDQKYSQ